MKQETSVQTAYLRLREIGEGVLRLADGPARAVLAVQPVNFALTGEVEREAIVAGFARCLNALAHPVQLLVRVAPVDLEPHLAALEARAAGALPPALGGLARDHAAFLARLAHRGTLLERRCYVVVPADPPSRQRSWRPGRRRDPGERPGAAVSVGKQLSVRCDHLTRELGRCGVTARRLGDAELAELLYGCWCPELARVQRLRRTLADYTTLIVQRGGHGAAVRARERGEP